MSNIVVPEFETYEEEANFWDNLDTADFMEDDVNGFISKQKTNEPRVWQYYLRS